MFAYCGDDVLFGSIAFSPTGVLYIADISQPSENRIFAILSDESIVHVAGYKSYEQQPKCPVERCTDIGGTNCTCLIPNYSTSQPDFIVSFHLFLYFRCLIRRLFV